MIANILKQALFGKSGRARPFGKSQDECRTLYLDLMQRCLQGSIYEDHALTPNGGAASFDSNIRNLGRDMPSQAHTMIGDRRLANLRQLAQRVLESGVAGDFIETGVWRGGACIFMRAILKAYGVADRKVWVADSFQGLPPPNEKAYPADKGLTFHVHKELAVTVNQVRENFEKYNLLDDQVIFLKGWFKDSLPNASISRLAILRLDGDMYESTMDALKALYHKLSIGGFVIVDDYGDVAACRAAVLEYREDNHITAPIVDIDGTGVYWQKLD